MAATPPIPLENSAASVKEITSTGGQSLAAGSFIQRYDKLVIAVGAYAQSEL
jgi:hypothetical protein